MEDTVLSLRIVTTSVVFLALATASALAQTATTTAPGKPLPLLQVFQKNDDTAAVTVTPHRRIRYVHRRTIKTRVASHTDGAMRDEYMQVQPAPEPAQPETAQATPQAATATALPANIWPTPDLTLPGTEGLMPTPMPATPFASEPVAPVASGNPNEALTAAYQTAQAAPQITALSTEQVSPPTASQITPPSTEQVSPQTAPVITPPSAEQVTPRIVAQITPPSAEQVVPPNAVQVAQANIATPADVAADEPRDAANTAKASNPVAPAPTQQVMLAAAEPQNPNPVGSPMWIAHALAALAGAIAAGVLAWVLINPLPVRSYE
jgi:hypothetical protein